MTEAGTNVKSPYVLVRRFDEGKARVQNKLLLSDYLLDGAEDAILSLKLPRDHFVLGVTYKRVHRKGKWVSGGDTQFFVTGSVEASEEKCSHKSAIFEIQEETRFGPSDEKDVNYVHTATSPKHKKKKPVKTDWFSCSIDRMGAVGIVAKRKEKRLKYKYKVSCIIHGTEHNMLRLLDSLPCSKMKGNDDIVGLAAMRVSDLCAMIPLIRLKQMTGAKYWLYWGM